MRRAVGKSRRTEKLRTGNSRSGSSRAPRSPAGRVPMRQHRSEFSGSPGGCRWKLVSLFLRFLLYKTLWRFATAISIYLLTYMGVFDLAYVSTYCQNCRIKPDIWHLGRKSGIWASIIAGFHYGSLVNVVAAIKNELELSWRFQWREIKLAVIFHNEKIQYCHFFWIILLLENQSIAWVVSSKF